MAKAKVPKENVVVSFEHQLIREIEAMVEQGTFPEMDISELQVMSPYDLWTLFYDLCANCKKNLSTFTIEMGNRCFDLKEEYEKEMKGLVAGEDVVLPPKKEKKGAAKKEVVKPEEPEEVILPPKKDKVAAKPKKVPVPKEVAEKKVEPKKKEVEIIVHAKGKAPKKIPIKKPVQQKVPVAKVAAKPKPVKPQRISAKKVRERVVPKPKDRYGFKQGTTVSLAAELMNGDWTMAQIAKKMGLEQNLYYVVNRLRDKGHTVRFKESKVTLIAAKKKKVA